MGSITYADFVQVPKFVGFTTTNVNDQALLTQLLDEAEQDTSEDAFGQKTARAIMLLAAHRYELSPASSKGIAAAQSNPLASQLGAVGTLTSISVSHGSNSASFSPYGKTKEEALALTRWGQELIELNRSAFVLGTVW